MMILFFQLIVSEDPQFELVELNFVSNYPPTFLILLIQADVGVFLVSMVLWFLDQFYCRYTKNYQLHAFWHVGTSLSILLGCLTLI